jgi:tetratricopeptide (TPR) repeat protein
VTSAAEVEESIRRYEGFAKLDPENPSILMNLGDLYHRAGRLEDALTCYRRCVGSTQHAAAARSRIASVEITAHRFDAAERQLQPLVEAEGDNTALLYNLALSQAHQEKWADAQSNLSRAIALGLDTTDAYRYLAQVLHHLGRMPEAIEACNKWLERARDTASEGYLALLEMDEDNMARAQALAREVLAKDPDDANAAVVVGTWSLEQQEMEQAEPLFDRLTQRQPENPRGWLGLGLVRMYQGKHADSIPALTRATELMPENPGTIVALGWAHLASRDAPAAQRVFERAVEVSRSFGEAYGGLASALVMQGRLDEAEAKIELALRLDRNGFGAQFARSVLLQVRGNKDAAAKLMARILEQRPRPDAKSLLEYLQVYGAKQLKQGAARRVEP